MGKWRVGTLSMGLLLIAVGILLLYAQFNGKAVVESVVRWWPVVLILIGGEVLIYTTFSRAAEPKVKYDIFSIFIITVIIFFGLGIYALTEVGLVDQLSKSISAQSYQLKVPAPEILLDGSIKKIVIEAPDAELVVRTVGGNTVLAESEAHVQADSQDTAAQLLGTNPLVSRQVGDTLFLSFNQIYSGSDMGYRVRTTGFSLMVPGDRQLEITGGSQVKMIARELKGDILFSGTHETNIEVPADADLKILATIEDGEGFQGNVPWQVNSLEETPEESSRANQGAVTFGAGTHKINILGGDRVTVNQVK